MMKQLTYLSILILWSCNSLGEQTTPLDGNFYIKEGWLAFSLNKYEKANKYFNTAREANEERSIYHFLSSIGNGWTHMYNAKTKLDSIAVAENQIVRSSAYFDIALSILPDLDDSLFEANDLLNLYSGLTLQRAYSAKQKAANEIFWETTNSDLSDEIDSLYRQSIAYSLYIEDTFVFQYDASLDYEDIILVRIGNYLLIGEIDSAVFYYEDYGFECNGNDVNDDSIIECLCITINDGNCPFGKE